MSQSTVAPVFAALLACAVAGQPAGAQGAEKPREIEIVATDYAFLPLPASISAGPTIFSFVNQGKVTHELSIGRLKPGVSVDDFSKTGADAPRRRDMVERSVGILIAGPGKAPDGRLLVSLQKGANYVVFCNLKDTPEAAGHLTFGMYTAFTAK
jgi:plastocyanin